MLTRDKLAFGLHVSSESRFMTNKILENTPHAKSIVHQNLTVSWKQEHTEIK